jgi:tetratricopeptide (TPR) repeat protein
LPPCASPHTAKGKKKGEEGTKEQPNTNTRRKKRKNKKRKNNKNNIQAPINQNPSKGDQKLLGEEELLERDWEALKQRGNQAFKRDQFTEAMNFYTQALQITSQEAVLFSNRALCELQVGMFDLAREDAEDAIGLQPNEMKYYRILSDALLKLGLEEEALEVCKKGLKVDPREPTLLIHSRNIRASIATKAHDYNASGAKKITTDLFPNEPPTPSAHYDQLKKLNALNPDPRDIENVNSLEKIEEGTRISAIVFKAHCFRDGIGTPKDMGQALTLYKEAAKKGSAEGEFLLLLLLLFLTNPPSRDVQLRDLPC